MVLGFKDFLTEAAPTEEGAKLKHITHAEDRPLFHGADGFNHAYNALHAAHFHTKQGMNSNKLTMKYDGSPSLVYGHNPENGKFFVASKSAFNKNPKLNYTPDDVEKNHGHAPGLVEKLKAALEHAPKIAPKKGVFQGDVMFTKPDIKKEGDKTSFTPNTITYGARGDKAASINKSKFGLVTHTKYEGTNLSNMHATGNVSENDFGSHPDIYHHTASYDAKGAQYSEQSQQKVLSELSKAKTIHETHGDKMYKAIHPEHSGDAGHLATYINQTVRTGETPSSDGFKDHVSSQLKKKFEKIKTPAKKQEIMNDAGAQLAHIDKNKEHYDNLLKMHSHLANAKNELVSSLESNEGGYEHSISGVASKPEGFVYNHTHNGVTEPTKLVNRSEFARQNLLKSRGKPGAQEGNTNASENHHTMAFGRMNPPTAGHEKLVNHMHDTAKKFGGGHTLVLSGSHDTKDGKNPLSPEQKLKHAKNAFPGTNIKVADKEHPTLLHHASELHKQGVTHLHFAGGSDRKPMAELLKKYNGVKGAHGHYNFKDISFENAGERDEKAKGVAGVSGTKLRELASSGKKEEFHSHLSSQMKPQHKTELYNDLRKTMK
jgi:hypothetical protein